MAVTTTTACMDPPPPYYWILRINESFSTCLGLLTCAAQFGSEEGTFGEWIAEIYIVALDGVLGGLVGLGTIPKGKFPKLCTLTEKVGIEF